MVSYVPLCPNSLWTDFFLAISQVSLPFVLVHPVSWPQRWITLSKTIRCETKDQTHPRVIQNSFLSPCLSHPICLDYPLTLPVFAWTSTPGRPFMLWLPLVVCVVLSAPLLSVPPSKLLLVGIVFFQSTQGSMVVLFSLRLFWSIWTLCLSSEGVHRAPQTH